MGASPPDLILLSAQTTTGAGLVIGMGRQMRYGNGGSTANQNQFPVPLKVITRLIDTTSGASATVNVQDSPDNVTFTTLGSFSLVIGAGAVQDGQDKLFKTQKRYVRAQLAAITGGSAPAVDAFTTFDQYGA